MNIKELFESIKARIERLEHTDKNTFSQVCETYGRKMEVMYNQFKKGQQEAPIAFSRYWMPWLLVNRIVMIDDLRQMSKEDQKLLGVIISSDSEHDEGRWVVIDGNHKATGSSRLFAFQDAVVQVWDEATVHAYNNTVVEVHSGWVHAFHDTTVALTGRGIIEAWDHAHVSVSGDALVYVNDEANLVRLPNSTVLEKKG